MTEPSPPRSRLLFVDLARAVTVLMMVQGHTLHVLLSRTWQENALFETWLFLRGLTAPMFMFLSGLSFSVATMRRWDTSLALGLPLLRRLARFVSYLLIGYALHFPVRDIRRLATIDAARWQSFYIVDVLQTVAVSLIVLQLLVLLCRRPWRFALCCAALGTAVLAATPAMRAVDWSARLWPPLAAYLYSGTGSIFPLFGWSAYLLLGAAAGVTLLQWPKPSSAATSAALLGLAAAVPVGLWRESRYPLPLIDARPVLLLNRLGGVLLLLAAFQRIGRRIARLPLALQALSEESLVVYFLHLCLLYGSIWGDGMWQWIGPRLGPLPTAGWVLAFLLGVTLVAVAWNRLKARFPRGRQVARVGIVLTLALPLLRRR